MQVADRWHLLRNLGEAVQGGVDRHRGAVRQAARAVSEETAALVSPAPPQATREERLRAVRRDRRQLCYEEMLRLHQLGLPGHAIGRAVGASMRTVYRWLKAGGPPTHNKPGATPQCRSTRGLPRPSLDGGLPQWRTALA